MAGIWSAWEWPHIVLQICLIERRHQICPGENTCRLQCNSDCLESEDAIDFEVLQLSIDVAEFLANSDSLLPET